MAVPMDNPSYFTLSGGHTTPRGKSKFSLFKKRMGPNASDAEFFKCATVNNRRQLRTLLRSVSSNSADSNQELLVLGEPRPSDIAPPSPYLQNRNRKTTKKSGDLHEDLIYCPLATSEEAVKHFSDDDDDDEEEEVFLSEDTARYYNIGKEPRRRHSIATYMTYERERALSVASTSKSCQEEVILHATADGEIVRAPSLGGSSRRSNKFTAKKGSKGAFRPSNMHDILIVSSKESEAACDWARYFSECFKQLSKQKGRPAPKILNLLLEDVTTPQFSPETNPEIFNVKLQLIIVCPHFLDLIEKRPEVYSDFGIHLKSDRIIAMLLGVTDESLTEVHHKILPNYSQWQRHVVLEDLEENFTKDFLTAAINILTKIVRQEQRQAIEDRTSFSITPKKVKMSQNRLIILLSEPLNPDDKTKVTVDKNGELIEIKSVKRPNPYTLKFVMPECCLEVSLIVKVLVEKNGDLLGMRPVKCESRLRELDQILRTSANPLEFMCQTLGFSPSSKEQLDNFLTHNFQKNLPPHFNLFSTRGQYFENPHQQLHSQEEFPTLLHFAAKYGLEKLTLQLLDCPGADIGIEMKNVNDMTPSEIAEKNGHNSLASAFGGYMKMNEFNEFTQIYSTLQEMAKHSENSELDTEYLEPIKVGSENPYNIPPKARPVESNILPGQTNGYIDMISQGKGIFPKYKSNENIVQNELSEILNDFKQEVTQVPEVENFVKIYKSINTSDSLTKQEKLKYVKEEYDKMQEKLQATKKGQTPFERFKKLFQRPQKKMIKEKSLEEATVSSLDGSSSHRPISSLSIQSSISSTSSGRMSTISIGDSGTHSDNEDRKFPRRSSDHDYLEIDENRLGNSNYMIPPAPRPVKASLQFSPINERPPQILPRDPDLDYILFPPSGLPVNGAEGKAKARTPSPLPPPDLPAEYLDLQDEPRNSENGELNEYMNITASQQKSYEDDNVEYETPDQFPEYMNFRTPQLPPRKQ